MSKTSLQFYCSPYCRLSSSLTEMLKIETLGIVFYYFFLWSTFSLMVNPIGCMSRIYYDLTTFYNFHNYQFKLLNLLSELPQQTSDWPPCLHSFNSLFTHQPASSFQNVSTLFLTLPCHLIQFIILLNHRPKHLYDLAPAVHPLVFATAPSLNSTPAILALLLFLKFISCGHLRTFILMFSSLCLEHSFPQTFSWFIPSLPSDISLSVPFHRSFQDSYLRLCGYSLQTLLCVLTFKKLFPYSIQYYLILYYYKYIYLNFFLRPSVKHISHFIQCYSDPLVDDSLPVYPSRKRDS